MSWNESGFFTSIKFKWTLLNLIECYSVKKRFVSKVQLGQIQWSSELINTKIMNKIDFYVWFLGWLYDPNLCLYSSSYICTRYFYDLK